jgi:transcriptional regulator with XRE-family HTH domain
LGLIAIYNRQKFEIFNPPKPLESQSSTSATTKYSTQTKLKLAIVTLLPPLKQIISSKFDLPKFDLPKLSILKPQPNQMSSDSDSDLMLPTPRETLAEIGDRLSELRQQQHLSIDEIAAKTQIQPRIVQAIELGQIELLPESVYVKGMVKRYGNSVGIDGSALAQELPNWDRSDVDLARSTILQTTGFSAATGIQNQTTGLKAASISQVNPLQMYLGYTLAIVGIGWGASHLIANSQGANRTRLAVQPATVPAKIVSVAKPKPAPLPNVNVTIEVKSPAWAQVGVDGATRFTGVLKPGTKLNLVATKQVTVSTNNGGGLLFAREKEQPQPLGKLGEKQNITLKVGKGAPAPKTISPSAP